MSTLSAPRGAPPAACPTPWTVLRLTDYRFSAGEESLAAAVLLPPRPDVFRVRWLGHSASTWEDVHTLGGYHDPMVRHFITQHRDEIARQAAQVQAGAAARTAAENTGSGAAAAAPAGGERRRRLVHERSIMVALDGAGSSGFDDDASAGVPPYAGTRCSAATLPAGSAATGSRAQPRQRARQHTPSASHRKRRRSSNTPARGRRDNKDKTEKQPAAAAAAAATAAATASSAAAVRAASAASPPCDVSPFTNAGCLTVAASTVARAPSRQATLVLARVMSAPAIVHGE
jgi:hypothetical protein